VVEKAKVPAFRYDPGAAVWAVDRVRRRHERIVRREDGELLLRDSVRVVGGTEGDQTADSVAFADLDEGPGDEAAQAVSDHIDLLGARRRTNGLQGTRESEGQGLRVDPWPIGEAREVADAPRGEEVTENEEVRQIAEETMHENDRGGVRSLRVEGLDSEQEPEW